MKNPHHNAPLALVSLCLFISPAASAERVQGLEFDPAQYQQRLEAGPGITAVNPVRSDAELKMSSLLGSLFNAGLRAPGVTVADVKAGMLQLGQIRSNPGESDELHVHVHVTEAAALDVVRPMMVEWVQTHPSWPMDEWPMIAGWVKETELAALALEPEVVFVQAVDPPRFRAGSVMTEGDALHHGLQARSAPLSLDGGNIRVGVISDGITSLAAAQTSGDLPTSVTVLNPGSGDEGTAMLEIIHDMAPGADLYFAASGADQTSFGNAVAALHGQGCDIICDDVGWYTDPFFEHSPTGMLIGNLQSMRDYLHVSAAGNDAQLHHQQVFTDTFPSPGGDGWHDPYLLVSMPPGSVLDVFMQWKEPLASTTVQSDYDLYISDYNTQAILAQSLTYNKVGEFIRYPNNTGGTIIAAVYVYRQSGTLNHDIEIFIEPQNGAVQYTNSTSAVDAIFGHPGYGSVLSVVATDVANPAQIEWFSSQGPFSIIAPPLLQPAKPNLAAADGVSISGAGGFATPFSGTSAAAPHVAGVLALAWSRSPGIPAAILRNPPTLQQASTDLGTPGFDNVFGWGRPLADQWANLLNQSPTISTPSGTLNCAQLAPESINGIVVSDPDAAANPLFMTLTISNTVGPANGIIFIDPNIPGGLTPVEIALNSTPNVQVTAAQAAIQTTFASPGAVVYVANPVPPGTTVADTLAITVNDQGNSGIGGPLLAMGTVNLLAYHHAYDAWQHDHFDATQLANPAVSGDTANPDGDLYDNQWEFFIGADPWIADSEVSPTVTTNAGNLVFRYRVSKEIPYGTPHSVTVSQNLVNWTNLPFNQMIQHPTASDAWLVDVIRPLSGNPIEFLRIRFNPRF